MTGDPSSAPDSDPGGARAVHWLLFADHPSAQEIEALLVSRTAEVVRIDDTTLGWQPGVVFHGPLTEEELRGAVGLPDWVHAVYVLDTPSERGQPIPPELHIPGSVLAAFPGGEPTGVERESLELLDAVARRLGGAVLTGTGEVVVPEPRIDLLVFSSVWLAEDELTAALNPVLTLTPGGGPVLPPGIEVEGYNLVAHRDEGGLGEGALAVTASPAVVVPLALAGYEWAQGALYVYEIRHYPPEEHSRAAAAALPQTPAEAEGMIDESTAAVVERAARTVLAATGGPARGHVLDDDGFLVLLD